MKENFFTLPNPSLGDPEDFLKFLLEHKEISEIGSKCFMEDPIDFNIMSQQLQYRYINGHYQRLFYGKIKLPFYPIVIRKLLDALRV